MTVIELQNGCVCCSLSKDFIATIDTIVRGDVPVDAVVVECSGVSEPESIVENWRQVLKYESYSLHTQLNQRAFHN